MAVQDRLAGFSGDVAVKAACVVRSTGNITLSSTQVVDGIAVGGNEERVLVGEQTDAKENGIYISANSTWIRTTDFDGSRDAIPATFVYVDRGNAYGETFWAFNSSSTATRIIIGTDDIVLSQITVALAGVTSYSQGLLGLSTASEWRSTDGINAQEDVITTQGDLVIGSSLGEAERKAKGSFGSILLSSSASLEWLSAGSSGQILQIESSQPTWTDPQTITIAFPQNYLGGWSLSNSTVDSDHDIIFAAGQARSDTNTFNIESTASITKAADSTWSQGSGQGGLDSGTVAGDTWYHGFAIARSDTGLSDGILSTASSGPTFPSTSWDEQRRVGSVLTDSTGNIVGFNQFGDQFLWNTPVRDSTAAASTDAVLHTLSVPDGVYVTPITFYHYNSSAAGIVNYYAIITSPLQDDVTPSSTLYNLAYRGLNSAPAVPPRSFGHSIHILTNLSRNIRSRSDTSVGEIFITTSGWYDLRGKE